MFLIALVAGLILLLTHGWFQGQHTVGVILIVVAAVLFALAFMTADQIRRRF